ncbi:MAG: deoxyribose-phosphate aldolase [Lachnospiraceae bacterium]|nr:deoxyribose-phosphate aldolase [Lachnospiraceae bacterium]
MDKREILSKVDHTLLRVDSTWDEIKGLIDDAIRYQTASVCIPPSFVKRGKEYAAGRMAICTVIGFPNGYNTTACKVFETKDAIANGADEVDMVINVGLLRDKDYDAVEAEIRALKEAAGDKILKVIVETCLLTEEEKVKICELITAAGADFIKTSTGFSTGGATLEDVKLFKEHVGPNVRIKASAGVNTMEQGAAFIEAGASRLGTSRLVKAVKAEEAAK